MKFNKCKVLIGFFLLTIIINADVLDRVQHGYVDNEGVKIHYVTMGSGPLVVMMHGFPDYWYTWRNQMDVLSENYQVVAVDLRGYNKSDKPKGVENYTMRNLIRDVVAVIKHFPQQKAIVIGHDWGGAIAWQVAIWNPQLVDRLIVLSTPHPNGLFREFRNNPDQKKNSQYARDFQAEDAHESLTAEGLAEWVSDNVKQQYIDAFNRSDFEAMLNYYKASFPSAKSNSPSKSEGSSAPSKFNPIKCPTLGIFGLEDKALLATGWNGTWDWIDNNLTLVSIPGAGHFVQHDNPEVVTNAIVSWLNKTNNSAGMQSIVNEKIKPFDKLLGTWNVTQSIRNRDGSWSVKPEKYQWKFYEILGGEALQDDWIVIDSVGNKSTAGTNIRIFNEEKNQWHMAWIDKTNRRTAVFTAKNVNGTVVMDGTNAQGRHIKNTFYNISENGFDWKQEWTFDEGQNWVEVARIAAEKKH